MNQLQQRADKFKKIIVDAGMDDAGAVRTVIMRNELRPVTDADMAADAWRHEGTSPSGFMCYEDAGMTTGGFLASESLRYEVTGDEDAKRNADKAFQGICWIYELGKEKTEGYFPKPYDRKISDQISRDQYIFAMTGMMNYYRIADAEKRAKIKRMMARMAGYWISIDYRSEYLGLAATSHLHDFMGPLFLGIIHYGYAFSGDQQFLDEFNRIFHEEKLGERLPDNLVAQFKRGEPYDGGMYLRQEENPIMMQTMAIDHLWDQRQEHADLWKRALAQYRDEELFAQLDYESGMVYFTTGYNPAKDQFFIAPPGPIEELTDPLGLQWIKWGGERKTAGSTQVAYSAAVIADRLQCDKTRDSARMILEKMDIDKFSRCCVPDPSHVPAGLDLERDEKFLDVCYLAYWLWAYWLGKARKLW